MFVYLVLGEFWLEDLEINDFIEYTFTFLYFLGLLWVYPKISSLVHSQALNRLKSIYLNLVEAIAIVVTTIILSGITKLLPIKSVIFFVNTFTDDNWKFDASAAIRDIIIHLIFGLFLYYFFERERILNQIREAHINYAQLQKEEFKNQLDQFKNQVNPEFLFDNLELIESFIKEDPNKAVDFVNRLSLLYRSFLEHREELIALHKEIKVAHAYFHILDKRNPVKSSLNINLSPEFLNHLIPPGSLQLILDLIFKGKHAGTYKINISAEEDALIISTDALTSNFSLSTEAGELQKIKSSFSYFSDRQIECLQLDKEFQVKLPLLKLEGNKSTVQ
jgi:sensor histidine kinase YesM